jgi:hypothetical protein
MEGVEYIKYSSPNFGVKVRWMVKPICGGGYSGGSGYGGGVYVRSRVICIGVWALGEYYPFSAVPRVNYNLPDQSNPTYQIIIILF